MRIFVLTHFVFTNRYIYTRKLNRQRAAKKEAPMHITRRTTKTVMEDYLAPISTRILIDGVEIDCSTILASKDKKKKKQKPPKHKEVLVSL